MALVFFFWRLTSSDQYCCGPMGLFTSGDFEVLGFETSSCSTGTILETTAVPRHPVPYQVDTLTIGAKHIQTNVIHCKCYVIGGLTSNRQGYHLRSSFIIRMTSTPIFSLICLTMASIGFSSTIR